MAEPEPETRTSYAVEYRYDYKDAPSVWVRAGDVAGIATREEAEAVAALWASKRKFDHRVVKVVTTRTPLPTIFPAGLAR